MNLNQTFKKVIKIFGESVKRSVLVVITHKKSVPGVNDYRIAERIEECRDLGVNYILWESKDITESERRH